MKKTFRFAIVFLLCTVLCTVLSGCGGYDTEWIVGKTSVEIQEQYGTFYMVKLLPDSRYVQADTEVLYTNAKGYYLIEDERVGWLGTYPEEYFVIRFDENGIAVDCYEELGGKGG
ncbi:MAG: hypothetical protein E7651_08235 [Ruminococcaceae bacterium]|nr:hypothetical protein [Oscillospiraceae bacterium]